MHKNKQHFSVLVSFSFFSFFSVAPVQKIQFRRPTIDLSTTSRSFDWISSFPYSLFLFLIREEEKKWNSLLIVRLLFWHLVLLLMDSKKLKLERKESWNQKQNRLRLSFQSSPSSPFHSNKIFFSRVPEPNDPIFLGRCRWSCPGRRTRRCGARPWGCRRCRRWWRWRRRTTEVGRQPWQRTSSLRESGIGNFVLISLPSF